MVALNTLMIVSTIVVGAHYLIDIVAGTAVAVASVWVTVRIVRPGWNQYLPGRSIR